jgi:hypothetical protein
LVSGDREPVFTSFHEFSPVCGVLLKLMLCRRNTTSTGVLLLVWKMKTHPHEPKDALAVEKVSLAVLAVFGVVGLACFIATALEVLPIISASWAFARLAHTLGRPAPARALHNKKSAAPTAGFFGRRRDRLGFYSPARHEAASGITPLWCLIFIESQKRRPSAV